MRGLRSAQAARYVARMADNEKLAVVPEQELRELRRQAARAEDGAIVAEGENAALKRVGNQIRHSPALMPWMLAYAEWLTLECLIPPKVSSKIAKARGFARAPVAAAQLKVLEARLDFQAYQRELERGPLEAARAKFLAAFPEYVTAHKDALTLATEAKDYRAMAQIAEPVLDRVMPKKSEAPAATTVNIVLTPQQVQSVAAYRAPEVSVVEETVVDAEVTDDSAST